MSRAPGRVLAIDLGNVRIGLALSDPLGVTTRPLPALRSSGRKSDLNALCDVILEHEVGTVVIGLPLMLSGEEGRAALSARAWADRLRGRLSEVEIELWDERLTTVEVERKMIDGGVRRSKRKESIDSMAAALILQSYLDASADRDGESGA